MPPPQRRERWCFTPFSSSDVRYDDVRRRQLRRELPPRPPDSGAVAASLGALVPGRDHVLGSLLLISSRTRWALRHVPPVRVDASAALLHSRSRLSSARCKRSSASASPSEQGPALRRWRRGPDRGVCCRAPVLAWGIAHSRPNPRQSSRTADPLSLPGPRDAFQKLVLARRSRAPTRSSTPSSSRVVRSLVTALNLLPLGSSTAGTRSTRSSAGTSGRSRSRSHRPRLHGLKWPGW